jgi:hypothetical protein
MKLTLLMATRGLCFSVVNIAMFYLWRITRQPQ